MMKLHPTWIRKVSRKKRADWRVFLFGIFGEMLVPKIMFNVPEITYVVPEITRDVHEMSLMVQKISSPVPEIV